MEWPGIAHLGMLARLEEGRDTDEAILKVPHAGILAFIVRDAERVAVDCMAWSVGIP